MITQYHISTYLIMLAIVSFAGFVVENIWLAFTKGFIDNRNMNAPFLLGYGLLILGFYFLFGTPGKMKLFGRKLFLTKRVLRILCYFLLAFLVVSICEVLLGSIVEGISKVELWNYTRLPLHVTKYTSVPTSCGFATIITVVMGKIFTPMMQWLEEMDQGHAMLLGLALTVILVVDFLVNAFRILRSGSLYTLWRYDIKNKRMLTGADLIS